MLIQSFTIEGTMIMPEVLRGKISLASHAEVAKDPLPLLKAPTQRVGERNDQISHHAIRLKINDGSQVK